MWVNDGSKEFSLINWKDTTANATEVNTMTWAVNQGFTGGSPNYINTNFQGGGSFNYQPTAFSASVWIGIEDAGTGNFQVGNTIPPNLIFGSMQGGANYWTRFNTAGGNSSTPNGGNPEGIFYLVKNGGTTNLYRNGSFVDAASNGNSDLGGPITIGLHNEQYSTARQSFFAAGGQMESLQSNIYNIINFYLSNP